VVPAAGQRERLGSLAAADVEYAALTDPALLERVGELGGDEFLAYDVTEPT
jgi:hypothetical protein